jgi:hypothetical protein
MDFHRGMSDAKALDGSIGPIVKPRLDDMLSESVAARTKYRRPGSFARAIKNQPDAALTLSLESICCCWTGIRQIYINETLMREGPRLEQQVGPCRQYSIRLSTLPFIRASANDLRVAKR